MKKPKKVSRKKVLTEQLKEEITTKMLPIRNILRGINKRSEILEKQKAPGTFDELYNLLTKLPLLVQAYGNIQRNKGSLTPGTTPETVDATSLNKLQDLANKLKSGKFKFTKLRRIWIEKLKIYKPGEKKKKRPLSIPNFQDRIVQESIRMILEAIYEPVFSTHDLNYGFRPNKSCQAAINKIKYLSPGMTLAIEGDIESAYDTVNHDIMLKILSKKIEDKRFLNLLKQGFKCGILDKGHQEDSLLGVPQGGLASPILFNIYMNEFDDYINNELANEIAQYNQQNQRKEKPGNKQYNNAQVKLDRERKKYLTFKNNRKFIQISPSERNRLFEFQRKLKELSLIRAKIPSLRIDNRAIKLLYTRYADDWIILTNATMQLTIDIKDKIQIWLKQNLELNLSPTKTKITNLKTDSAKFIGFSLKTYLKRRITVNEKGEYTKRAGWDLIIDIDIQRNLDRLLLKGFCNRKFKPIAKRPWSVLQPEIIVTKYNYIMRGIGNFYFPVIDRLTQISRIFYILKFSCLSTFAKKYKSKITKITRKYGDPLTVTISEKQRIRKGKDLAEENIYTKKTFTLLNYQSLKKELDYKKFNWKDPEQLKRIGTSDVYKPMQTINWRSYRNLTQVCAICGTGDHVEMHHIKHIRKEKVIGFAQVLKQINRTTIPLCRTHHHEVHTGKYADIKLSDLYEIERFLL
jgi:retron-type reverse transcriptase